MKMYITKYALTKGVYISRGEIKGGYFYDNNLPYIPFSDGEYFNNECDAIDKAGEMRSKKIESLKKQMARIKALNF